MKNSIRAAILLLAVQAAAPAAAWDWVRQTPAETAAPALQWMGQAPDGTLWGADYYAVYKLPADGSQASSARILGELTITPDGEVSARADDPGGTSSLIRLGADLRPRWVLNPAGKLVEVKADGTAWLTVDGVLTRLNSIGTGTSRPVEESLIWTRAPRARFADANSSVLLVPPPDSPQALPFRLVQRNATGAPDWHVLRASHTPPTVSRDETRADGDILLIALTSVDFSNARQSHILRLDKNGRLRNEFDYPQIDAQTIRVVWRPDGGYHLLFWSSATRSWQVATIEVDGRLAWMREVSGYANNFGDNLSLLPAANGDLVALWPLAQGSALQRFAKADGAGALRQLPFTVSAATLTSDGRLLASVREAMTVPARLVQIGSDGSAADIPQAWPRRDANSRTVATEVLPDGSSFVLTAADEYPGLPGHTLSRIAPDGSLSWAVRGQGVLADNTTLAADAAQVCIGGGIPQNGQIRQRVECHAAGDGTATWSRELETAKSDRATFVFRRLADGRTVALYNIGDESDASGATRKLMLTVLDNSGNVLVSRSYDDHLVSSTVAIDEQGRSTFMRWSYLGVYRDLLRLDSRGEVLFTRTRDQLGISVYELKLREDGSAILRGSSTEPGSFRSQIALMTNTGDISWRREPQSGCGSNTQLSAYGVLSYCISRNPDGSTTGSVVSRDLASGDTRWTYALPTLPGTCSERDHREGLTSDGKALVIAYTCRDRVYLHTVDTASGQRIAQSTLACAADQCAPQSLTVAGDGVARVTMLSTGTAFGQYTGIYAKRVSATPPAPARLDQPGIGGAWWSPYANGEGIALDWFPAQRTLFGAWFTYTTAGGNDPAQLRWYTIQAGNVATNATSVQLPILETTGGNFDAGPPASPISVGTATLTFTDCDNATLNYAFDAGHNDGVTGTITLSRLTPATESCILADGTTRPGAGAKPPQGGFDARMSGTWFEEATSGQGLQFTVQPGGVFFAPWFTYDPQGQGNDTNREHWFTLQGNLANAANGKAEVLIAQSLGGAFDRVPTTNGFAVGKATVTMTACDKARVDYRFDDSELAGSFRKLSGTLVLSKIGGCNP